MHGYGGSYALVAIVGAVGVLLVMVAFGANRALRPHRPTSEKAATYECGIDPVGEGWAQSYVRYFMYAYLYVVFAVDVVFLFPWATVFSAHGYGPRTFGEMMVFLGFLTIGLGYAWRQGVLSWA